MNECSKAKLHWSDTMALAELERATNKMSKAVAASTEARKNSKMKRLEARAGKTGRDRELGSVATIAPKIESLKMIQMDVTPDIAAKWLEGKCPNRGVSEQLVNKFARDMIAGAWHLNGETIVFDINEALLDGQHRLWAIVESGCTVRMCVVKGADPKSMDTYDTGRSRSFADVLKIRGSSANPSLSSAAARWWRWYDNFRTGNLSTGGNPSHDELRLSFENHPSIETAIGLTTQHSASNRKRTVVPGGIMTFVLSGALEANEIKAEQWYHQVATGENLKVGDPAYTLRERMIQDKSSLRRMDNMTICAYTMKSWNAFYRGRDLKHLKWGIIKGGAQEAFPEFEGRNNTIKKG